VAVGGPTGAGACRNAIIRAATYRRGLCREIACSLATQTPNGRSMIEVPTHEQCLSDLARAGFARQRCESWLAEVSGCQLPGSFDVADHLDRDAARVGRACSTGWGLLDELPPKSGRNPAERDAGRSVLGLMTDLCRRFLRPYRCAIYQALTRGVPCRIEVLARRAGERFPGVVPSVEALRKESGKLQKDKDGLEIFQGLLFRNPAQPLHYQKLG